MITAQPIEYIFNKTGNVSAKITVVLTCFKYGKEAIEALESLTKQTEEIFDVILIDDCSPDDSINIMLPWFKEHHYYSKFNNLFLIKHLHNQGLSQARNTAISLVKTPYVFILDADNQIYPKALSVLRQALEISGAQMSYSLIEVFGDQEKIINNSVWIEEKFLYGNYIDAMALIRTDILHKIGGYRIMPHKFGWEDYDLWCTFVDKEYKGCHVPQILCRYRVHSNSMLRITTNEFLKQRIDIVRKDFEYFHNKKFYF